MKTAILSSAVIATAALFTACSPKYYIPNTQNVPLISQKGETSLNLNGNGNQVEFQGTYGIGNNVAVQANGGLYLPNDLDNGDGGSGKFVEIGAGYYAPIKEHWVFETYGIAGVGSVENHFPSSVNDYPNTTGDISASVLRLGLQPNFGFKTKYFAAGLSSRIVNLSYNNVSGDLIYDGIPQRRYLDDNANNFLLEPALTIRGGFEKLKLQLQYGYSFNLSNSSFRQDNAYLTVGLNFNFY